MSAGPVRRALREAGRFVVASLAALGAANLALPLDTGAPDEEEVLPEPVVLTPVERHRWDEIVRNLAA